MLAVETFEFLERVGTHYTQSQIANSLHKEANKLGFHGLTMSWLPQPGSRQAVSFEPVEMPLEYYKNYVEGRYERFSPVVRRMSMSSLPFARSEVTYDAETQPMAHRVMTEARDFGIQDAWAIPVYHQGRLTGWVCSASDLEVIPSDKIRQLHVMSLWAHARVRQFRETSSNAGPRLSPREREVVSWLAAGKTADDIGSILSLSPRTVEYHITNAGIKLGTSNRTHTVVEAIRLKQIYI